MSELKRYSVSFNSIVEAENEVAAIQIFKESADYGSVECFEYGPSLTLDNLTIEDDKS